MKPPLKLKPEEIQNIQRLVKISAIFQRVFGGADGEFVLDYLEKQRRGFNKDPYQHAYNAGIGFLLNIIKDFLDDKKSEMHKKFLEEQKKE